MGPETAARPAGNGTAAAAKSIRNTSISGVKSFLTTLRNKVILVYSVAQPLVSYILLNVFLGNSPGWWANTVATYRPSRPSRLKNINKIWRTRGCATLYDLASANTSFAHQIWYRTSRRCCRCSSRTTSTCCERKSRRRSTRSAVVVVVVDGEAVVDAVARSVEAAAATCRGQRRRRRCCCRAETFFTSTPNVPPPS